MMDQREEDKVWLDDKQRLWSILDGVYEFDLQGRLTYANAACRRLFGYAEDESLDDLNIRDLISEEDREPSRRDIQLILEGQTLVAERKFFSRNGSCFYGEVHSGPLLKDGKIIGIRGVLRDISRRKEAEAALRESEQRFKTVFDLSPNAVALTEESSGKIVDINACFEQITGFSRSELIGRKTTEMGFYSGDDRKRFLDQLLEHDQVNGLPMIFRAKDGSDIHAHMFARRIHIGDENLVMTIFQDETHKKRLEAQFYQAQKMEAVGTLAAGVAHDFNNLLMGIQGYVSLLLSEIDSDSVLFSRLTEIEKQIGKGANLTRLLLGFARRGSYDAMPTNLNILAKNNIEMFGRAKKRLTIHEKLQKDVWPVEVDSGQMDQVLINLFVNSWHAMPQGGDLTIETSNQLLDAQAAELYSAEPGKYVRVRVQDNGCGMDLLTKNKIFEPFFTTKERGVGTGLGLASAYGIINRHGGFITVESEPGRGTIFDIFLPACEEPSCHEPARSFEVQRGSGTILTVDDDEVVRDASRAMLEKLGYRVLTAAGGAQAIEIYEKIGPEIDLLILDLVMPHIDGRAVFRRITSIDAHQKILFSTGCDIQAEFPELGQSACQGIIQKPYTIQSLSAKVRSILGA